MILIGIAIIVAIGCLLYATWNFRQTNNEIKQAIKDLKSIK